MCNVAGGYIVLESAASTGCWWEGETRERKGLYKKDVRTKVEVDALDIGEALAPKAATIRVCGGAL